MTLTVAQRQAFGDVQARLKYSDARILDALTYIIARERGWARKYRNMSAQTMLDCVELGWLDSHGSVSSAGRAAITVGMTGVRTSMCTFDARCHDLAALFLGDEVVEGYPAPTADEANELAGEIQQTIEDYLARRHAREGA